MPEKRSFQQKFLLFKCHFDGRNSLGGGTGGSQSPASRTPFFRLPCVFVPLSHDFRPLLCFSVIMKITLFDSLFRF